MTGRRPDTDHTAARAALRDRRFDDAHALLRRSLADNPDDVDAHCLSALAYWRAHAGWAAAEAHLDRALELRPDDAGVLTLSAEFALHFGEIDRVFALAGRALALDPGRSAAMIAMARADPRRIDDAVLQAMARIANDGTLDRGRQRFLLNAIGRVLDARGRFDEAFACFSRSNALAPGTYDPAAQDRRLAVARRVFTPAFFAERADFGRRGHGCIFVIGPPRTGSTLIEHMLASYPGVATCGESDAMLDLDRGLRRRHLAQTGDGVPFAHVAALEPADAIRAGADYLSVTARQLDFGDGSAELRLRVDKKLSNFLHAGLIRLLFPDAVLLRVKRHPLDVCLSCFMQGFEGHAYANDLEHLAHFYRLQHDYMDLWSSMPGENVYTLGYESYVTDPQRHARALTARLGLTWNPQCLHPGGKKRFVETSSAAQVRAPINSRAVARWRNYEKHLQPLIRELGGMSRIEEMAAAAGRQAS